MSPIISTRRKLLFYGFVVIEDYGIKFSPLENIAGYYVRNYLNRDFAFFPQKKIIFPLLGLLFSC